MLPHNTSPITHNVQLPVSSPAAHTSCPSSPKIFFSHTAPSTAIVPLSIHHQDPLLLTQTSNQQPFTIFTQILHHHSDPSTINHWAHGVNFISTVYETTDLPTSALLGILSFDPTINPPSATSKPQSFQPLLSPQPTAIPPITPPPSGGSSYIPTCSSFCALHSQTTKQLLHPRIHLRSY